MKNILSFLFILFGLYAIINPVGISLSNLQKSYSEGDLIRAWGIYAVVLGAILYFPLQWKIILISCFVASILLHIEISIRKGWTAHHKHSISINFICLMMILCCLKLT